MQAIIPTPTQVPTLSADDAELIYENRRKATSERTKQAYQSALTGRPPRIRKDGQSWASQRRFPTFAEWCEGRGFAPVPAPPAMVELYLGVLGKMGAKAATIEQRASAISHAHKIAGAPNPCEDMGVKSALQALRKGANERPETRKQPKAAARLEDLRAMVATLPDDQRGCRDKAILLLGWAAAMRRSEIVALDVGDLRFGSRSLTLTIRGAKTDKTGQGQTVTLTRLSDSMLCPVRALQAWLAEAGITEGAVFRAIDRWGHLRKSALNDREVARIVQRAAEDADLTAIAFGGHSLRRGFITQAAEAGAAEHQIRAVSRHAPGSRVLHDYIEAAGHEGMKAQLLAFGLGEANSEK